MSGVDDTSPVAADDSLGPIGTAEDARFAAAYARRLEEIRAVPDDQLASLNIDVRDAISIVLGAIPKVGKLRDRMAKLPEFDVSIVDGLRDYAGATAVASSRHSIALAPADDIERLKGEARVLRATIRADALALARRGLIDRSRFARLRGNPGYSNLAFGLMAWASLMEDCWDTIQGKTPLGLEEIQHARQLGERLVVAVGARKRGPKIAETARIRHQAFTLMVRAYDQVRRGITFLRWSEGDVDTIAPSLYAGRGGHGKSVEPRPADGEAPAEAQSVVADADAASGNGLTGMPSVPQLAAPIPPGFPGASPFVDRIFSDEER